MAREELKESTLRIESLTGQLAGLQKEVDILFYSLSCCFMTEFEWVSWTWQKHIYLNTVNRGVNHAWTHDIRLHRTTYFFFFLSIFNCCGQNITRTTSMSAAHNIAASSFSKLISGGSQHITSTYHGVTPTPPHQPEAFIQILQQLDSSNVNLSAPRYLRFKCLSMAIVLLTSSASTQLIEIVAFMWSITLMHRTSPNYVLSIIKIYHSKGDLCAKHYIIRNDLQSITISVTEGEWKTYG